MRKAQLKAHDSNDIIYSQYNENHVLIRLKDSVNPNDILERLHAFFDKLLIEGIQQIAFDMGNVPFPSGSFIALLIGKTIEIRHRGGDLQIVNLLDTARNNLSFFTPLTFLSIVSDADHITLRDKEVAQKPNVAEGENFDELDNIPHRLRVNATVDALQDVTDFVTVWAKRTVIDSISCSKLKIAVHEACMNVIEHGYKFADAKEIEIEVNLDETCFKVMISDWGVPFEKFGKRDYDVQEAFEKQQRGGYGFYIMQQSVDEIRYEFGEDGNRLTLILEYVNLLEKKATKSKK
ncbi:ATP-binding protein [bacterium]